MVSPFTVVPYSLGTFCPAFVSFLSIVVLGSTPPVESRILCRTQRTYSSPFSIVSIPKTNNADHRRLSYHNLHNVFFTQSPLSVMCTTAAISLDDLSNLFLSKAPVTLEKALIGPIAVSSSGLHGRGVFATRDVEAGECLFCTLPTVSAPIQIVMRIFQSKPRIGLEQIAETILLKNMKRSLKCHDKRVAASVMLLTSDDKKIPIVQENEQDMVSLLTAESSPSTCWWGKDDATKISDEDLLLIIRRNAFGPDFYSYDKMQDNIFKNVAFHRILGLYPLAAMLNHSCTPNAVRVFCGEYMVVHATHQVKTGDEFVWSYIPPTRGYKQRQLSIQNFGFTCTCPRCTLEKSLSCFEKINSEDFQKCNKSNQFLSTTILERPLKELEALLRNLSNEEQRYVRVGCMNLYLNYFNAALRNSPNDAMTQDVLTSATHLHLAFCACGHSSTEHLSILHLCYDLASNPKQVRFWTDQLKRAHMIRYGKLGHQVEAMRACMVHTKLVLRNLNGLAKSDYAFI